MATTSNNATFQLTASTNRQSRIADAVQVAPYLTHVVRHHGQVTLIPPENSGRIRKAKKKRPALREENSSSSLDLLRPTASRSRTHAPRPDSVRNSHYETDSRVVNGVSTGRGQENIDEMSIPNFPPPTFEEAMLATPSPRESISPLLADVQPLALSSSADRNHALELALPPPEPLSQASSPPPAETPVSEQNSPHLSFEHIRDGHSQWEEDREAGFSLEERVRRELERRQLTNSLPQATSLSNIRRESVPVIGGDMLIGNNCAVDEPEDSLTPQLPIDTEPDLSLSHEPDNPVSDHTEASMALKYQLGSPQNTLDANLSGPSISKGKGRDFPSEPSRDSKSSSSDLHNTPEGSTMSKIKEVLNVPLRIQPSPTVNSDNPATVQPSPPPRSYEQSTNPSHSHDASTSLSVSSKNNNSIFPHVSTDPVLLPNSSLPQTTIDAYPRIPPSAISNSSTLSLSQRINTLPSPPSNLPSLPASSPHHRPLPPHSGRSVRDRIAAFESLQNRPVPPPPPLRPVIRRSPPPIPVSSVVVERQLAIENREERRELTTPGHHTHENAPSLPPRRRAPPPLPPRRNHPSNNRDSEPGEASTQIQLNPIEIPSAPMDMLNTTPASSSTINHLAELTAPPNDIIPGRYVERAPNPVDDIGQESIPLTLDVARISENSNTAHHSAVGEDTLLSTHPGDASSSSQAVSIIVDDLSASTAETGVDGASQVAGEHGEWHSSIVATGQATQPPEASEDLVSTATYQDSPIPGPDLASSSSGHREGSNDAASRQGPEPSTFDTVQLLPLRPMFTGPTELDLLLARLDDPDFTFSGQSYDDLLLLEEIMGPALTTTVARRTRFEDVSLGKVEVLRRRVTKDGRTKLKLALLGVVVDKCGICLVQFKEGVHACLPPCHHAFHDSCLRLWMRRSDTCPMCRGQLCAL